MARDEFLKSEDFGLRLYNMFPSFYRDADEGTNFALKRYLQVCGDGGFKYAIDEWNGILNTYNPENIDYNMLTILYQQFGFELFYGIPESYLRYLLPRLSEAWAKKGSLDVVEFVVSALSGIKTITEVYEDEDDDENVYMKVILEMDYALGDYFPNPEQFDRILKQFVPFYIDSTLVYSYLFYETQKVWLNEDYFYDIIKDSKVESAFIPFDKGTRFSPTLNQLQYTLNDSVVTNGMETYEIDPDVFFDVLHTLYSEIGRIRKNADSIYEKVKMVIAQDNAHILGSDSRYDHLNIDGTYRYLPSMNTDLRLNVDLFTNRGSDDRIHLHSDELTIDKYSYAPYNEVQTLVQSKVQDKYQGLFTNVSKCVLNRDYILIPDTFDVVRNRKTGVQVTAFPSLYEYVGA